MEDVLIYVERDSEGNFPKIEGEDVNGDIIPHGRRISHNLAFEQESDYLAKPVRSEIIHILNAKSINELIDLDINNMEKTYEIFVKDRPTANNKINRLIQKILGVPPAVSKTSNFI